MSAEVKKKQDYDHIYPNSYMQIHDFMTTPIHIYKWKYVISWLQMSKFIKANIYKDNMNISKGGTMWSL